MDLNQSQISNLKSQNLGQQGTTNQPIAPPLATTSTNLDPLTQPSAPTARPSVAPVTPPPVLSSPSVSDQPSTIYPQPSSANNSTPPAQDTFAPTPAPAVSTTVDSPTPTADTSAPSATTQEPPATSSVKNALLDHYPTGSEIIEEDILKLLGASDMSEEEKNDLYQKMNDTVANRVTARIVDALTDEEVDKWTKLLDENKEADARKMLEEKGVDLPKLIAQEAVIYKTQLVDTIYGSDTIKNQK